jgi:hypothetical protein
LGHYSIHTATAIESGSPTTLRAGRYTIEACESGKGERMTEQTSGAERETPGFAALYAGQEREAVRDIARAELEKGADAAERARDYAEHGKPDFALAYLLASDLPDDERRSIYADSYEQRAARTEVKARELDKTFHRAFPLLFSDAAQDRALAKRIRDGRGFGQGAGKQLPMV